ncbi:hypothetical protein GM418_08075 [Maribellus comscasis]|uniref:Tetratricopeptide repeat protein n=1 Tax=Maribellus comscasis TaxID=2681766 RepID=A0A6I6JQZ7_9BACT|nr:hypothetical protein [Maribellus comscasis]QGY43619.1 hypothetical protein GM418_08075 [Maribellus comscasis]
MKKILIITLFVAVYVSSTFASGYEETMGKNIEKMYKITSGPEMLSQANQFLRIASVEKDKWLPKYYASYCFVMSTVFGEMSADEKHQRLDMAQKEMDVLKEMASEESEVYALQAFIYQLRITDMTKGMKYSGLANEVLAVAEKLEPENPRVYYLRGMNTYHTPKMFGGGAEKAKPFFEKAAEKFEAFEAQNALSPNWGKEHNAQMLKSCQEE